jgi:hypothetical protein
MENFSSILNLDEAAAANGSFIALTEVFFNSSCFYASDDGNILLEHVFVKKR